MSKGYVNWGIIAPGRIANKAAEALRHLEDGAKAGGQPSGVRCYAVAARDGDRAEAFRAKWGFKKSYEGYDALFADGDVDAVYIASPHTFHAELSLKALEAGKAVVCEKPAAVNGKQLSQVCALAKKSGLFYMEAMWMAFNPCVARIMQWLRDKRIGRLLEVNASFCFRNEYNPKDRLFAPALAGGALLDVSIYPITFAMMSAAQDGQSKGNVSVPSSITTAARIDKGVDLWNASTLMFSSGAAATVKGAIDEEMADGMGSAYLYGTEGYIRAPMFWCGEKAELYLYNGASGGEAILSEAADLPFACNGYEYEMDSATKCILEGKTEADGWGQEDSLSVCDVMDKMRAKWGLCYPFERE